MKWYSSQVFFVSGKGPVDILFKQIVMRLGWETFIFALSCLVGALGGWVYILLTKKKETPQAKP